MMIEMMQMIKMMVNYFINSFILVPLKKEMYMQGKFWKYGTAEDKV